jgi:hypothetical protein
MAAKDKKKKPDPKDTKAGQNSTKEKESLVKKLNSQDSLFGSLMEENFQVLSKVKKPKKKY